MVDVVSFRRVNAGFGLFFTCIYIASVFCCHGIFSFGASVCLCCYNGKTYTLNETVYSHMYGTECGEAVCGPDGQIIKTLTPCRTPSTPAQGTRLIRGLVVILCKSIMVIRFIHPKKPPTACLG